MKNIDIAKKNYERGLWSDDMLEALQTKGKITKAEKDAMKSQVALEKSNKKLK